MHGEASLSARPSRSYWATEHPLVLALAPALLHPRAPELAPAPSVHDGDGPVARLRTGGHRHVRCGGGGMRGASPSPTCTTARGGSPAPTPGIVATTPPTTAVVRPCSPLPTIDLSACGASRPCRPTHALCSPPSTRTATPPGCPCHSGQATPVAAHTNKGHLPSSAARTPAPTPPPAATMTLVEEAVPPMRMSDAPPPPPPA
jgi:hypothetical protein